MSHSFADRLTEAVRSKDSCLVVGLDPVLERLPREIVCARDADADPRERAARAIEAYQAIVLEDIAPYACAVKPQIAYYEAWGPAGLAAYERAIEQAKSLGLLVIGDVKRGDIGSTAGAYAQAHLVPGRGPTADAITVNPYLGTDSVTPFLTAIAEHGAGIFVLVRTSNPSATELQDLQVGGQPLHERVAALVSRWGEASIGASGFSSVGAVVGATAPEELTRLRSLMPSTWFLVPGVGAQGGTARDVAGAFTKDGLGAVVNSSRGILYAYGNPDRGDWRPAVAEAARALRDELRLVTGASGGVTAGPGT